MARHLRDALAPGSESSDPAPNLAPGRAPASARITPRHQVVLRVESAEAAQALAGVLGPRDANGVTAGADAAVDRAASSSGAPLPADARGRFEGSLGADLSAVRVHTGADSAQAADAVGARAYTVGNDIHFADGQYAPSDPFGMHLLAHEVAHTQQQAGATPHRQHKLEVSTPGDAAEVEADRAADAMVAGAPAAVSGSSALARTVMREATPPGQAPAPAPGGAEGGGGGPAPAATPIPDPGQVGKDPKHPLPEVAKAEVQTQYAVWKVKFFQSQLREMEKLGAMPGRGPLTSSPQYQATQAKVQGYQTDSARLPEINSAWTSFQATGNMAAAQLADHVAMKEKFGFADLSKTIAGLSKKDKDQVGDDLAKMEAQEGKIAAARVKVSSAAGHLGPQQLRFIGSSKELAGFMTHTVANELQKKLAEAKEEKEKIQQNIERAAAIGDGIQHAVQDVVGAISAVNAAEATAEKTVEKVDEDLKEKLKDKGKELKEHASSVMGLPEAHTLLGSIVEKIAKKIYQPKIDELNNVIKSASDLLDVTNLTAEKQTLEGLRMRMDADLNEMLATLGDLGTAAKELNDAMTAAEQPKLHTPQPPPNPGSQPSEAARKVEQFTASGMAATALLDPAIASGEAARNQILTVAGASKGMRAMPWYSTAKQGAYSNEGHENDPKSNAFAEKMGELHQDDGVKGPDMAMVDGMLIYLAQWIAQAQAQKGAIATELQQAASLKA
jgi:hypothetical protein